MSKGNEIYCGFLGAITKAQNEAAKREKQEQRDLNERKLQVLNNLSTNLAKAISENISANTQKDNQKPIVIENLTINIIVDKNKGC